MIPFLKMVKFLNKNGTTSEKNQNSSIKIVPFQSEKGQIPQQKWYNFKKGSKILDKNGTISEKGLKISSTKMVPF